MRGLIGSNERPVIWSMGHRIAGKFPEETVIKSVAPCRRSPARNSIAQLRMEMIKTAALSNSPGCIDK